MAEDRRIPEPPPQRGGGEQQATEARQLLASRLHGVLSTVSVEMDGSPFGSVTPYCLDASGVPLFLLSHLAQHTKNLHKDPRAALTLLDAFEGDVQQAGRLTGVGEIHALDDEDKSAERYFRYFPQARVYFEQLGFRFYRLVPQRWHFNNGFATARWLGNDRLVRANPFGAGEAGVVEHMNRDHRDALRRCLAAIAVVPEDDVQVRLCGADGEGLDMDVGGRICRVALARPVTTLAGLRQVLVDMTRS